MDTDPKKILTKTQVKALDAFFSEPVFRENYYLTGGTALSAFYLQHRYSDDLGFFTHAENTDFLGPLIRSFERNMDIRVETRAPDFTRLRMEGELQIDIVRDIPSRVGVPKAVGAWVIDSLENITVNKVTTVLGRLDAKDYVDLYFLLKDNPARIMRLIEEASKKDAGAEPFVWSRIIADVNTLRVLPHMVSDLNLGDLTKFFTDLQEYVLKQIKPK